MSVEGDATMTRTTFQAKLSDRLWGAIRIWAVLFMFSAAAAMAAFGYRVWLVGGLSGDTYMTEASYLSDYVPGAEIEAFTTAGAALAYLVTYFVSAFLVLMWYLRSVRNAHALSNGVETSPKWAIWWFIIPLVSLWKPYSMTSELWRSSRQPDGWKSLPDPSLLRWWWGAVLVSGLVINVSSGFSRTAATASQLAVSDSVLIGGYALQIFAGVLFLRIGNAVSRQQTALISEGRVAPPSSQPTWAA